ncbi:hypothetical protein [Megasphaera elsdenii]|uniref:hypothetical protein n=1 Tax=Megasphaera elsdenii TaxID=907 RepID=UPI001474D47A|nr:hypothetical protein [Megasphaera elsdenii]NME19063.1 hypothetical protein [Megasphaera elsdenii]
MEYIINPWWFYLAGLFGKVEVLWWVIIDTLTLFVVLGLLIFLLMYDINHEQLMSIIKRKSKQIVAVLSVLALLFIAAPTQDTVNKMIIANALTTNNIKDSASFTQDQIGQIIDKIADAAIKVKQAENSNKT